MHFEHGIDAMPSFNLRNILSTVRNRGRSDKLADHISRYVENFDPRDLIHGHICWNAVITCMQEVSIISQRESDSLKSHTDAHNFLKLFPASCPIVYSRREFLEIKRGSLLGFFKFENTGLPYLAHAAISLGGGYVAGINGGGIGLPGHLSSENMENRNWGLGGNASFSFIDNGHQVRVQVRYRDIDDLHSPCAVM